MSRFSAVVEGPVCRWATMAAVTLACSRSMTARRVLRLENFDIENGPDLRLHLVPGAGKTEPTDDSLYLGELRGNVGDQTYDLRADVPLPAGDWTVLVWCEAFSVEFVAATVRLI